MAQRKTPADEVKAIGRRAYALRMARGIPQVQLARQLEVDASTLSALERGATDSVSLRFVRDLAVVLEVSYDQLMGRPGTTEPADGGADWEAGYRAGLAEATTAVRDLLQRHDRERQG